MTKFEQQVATVLTTVVQKRWGALPPLTIRQALAVGEVLASRVAAAIEATLRVASDGDKVIDVAVLAALRGKA